MPNPTTGAELRELIERLQKKIAWYDHDSPERILFRDALAALTRAPDQPPAQNITLPTPANRSSESAAPEPHAGAEDGERAEIERLAALVHVPGVWRCAKCQFTLIQSNLNSWDGTVTARDEAGDKCPNDGAPLWRVSYRDWAAENEKVWEEFHERELAEVRATAFAEGIEQAAQVAYSWWDGEPEEAEELREVIRALSTPTQETST